MMMMMEVREKMNATTQREKTVLQYASELRCLWVNLDHYDTLLLQNPTNVLLRKQYLECKLVACFLKGLNQQFEGRRAAMRHLPSLLSLVKAVASMEQEEIRQKVMTGILECTASVVHIGDDRHRWNKRRPHLLSAQHFSSRCSLLGFLFHTPFSFPVGSIFFLNSVRVFMNRENLKLVAQTKRGRLKSKDFLLLCFESFCV